MNVDTKSSWFQNVDKEALARVSQLAARIYNKAGYALMSIKDPEIRKLVQDLENALLEANFEVLT